MFEFLRWSPSFKEHERGVWATDPTRIGVLTYKRPHPLFDLRKWDRWFVFLSLITVGLCLAAICVVVASFFGFMLFIGWLVFCFLHFAHSYRFRELANLTDVDFMPIDKVYLMGSRFLANPHAMSVDEYYILFSRFFSADVRREPYMDVAEWVHGIQRAHAGDQLFSVRSGGIATSIGGMIGVESHEFLVREGEEFVFRKPERKELTTLLWSDLIPKYRELLGDDLALFYLMFLSSYPPILPYDKTTTRSEMCEVASADDTAEVLDYLCKFVPKIVYTVYTKGI